MSALITSFTGSKKNVSYISYSYQWQPRVVVPDSEQNGKPLEHAESLIPGTENEDLDASAADERNDTVPELLTRIPSKSDLKIARKDSANFMPVSNWFPRVGTPEQKRSVSPSGSSGSLGEERSWSSRTSVASQRNSPDRLRPSTAVGNLFFRRSRKGLDLGERAPSIRGRSVQSGAEGIIKTVHVPAEPGPRAGTKQKKLVEGSERSFMSPSTNDPMKRTSGNSVWESMAPTQSEIIAKAKIRPDPVRPPLPENAVFYTPPSKFMAAARPITAHHFRLKGQHSASSDRLTHAKFRDSHSLLSSQPSVTDLNYSTSNTDLRARHGSEVSEASASMDRAVRPFSRGGDVPLSRKGDVVPFSRGLGGDVTVPEQRWEGFQAPLRYLPGRIGLMPRQRSSKGRQGEAQSRKLKPRAASANDARGGGGALLMEGVLLPW